MEMEVKLKAMEKEKREMEELPPKCNLDYYNHDYIYDEAAFFFLDSFFFS